MKKWIIKNTNIDRVKLNSNKFLNRLLLSRGLEDNNQADMFLNPSVDSLYDPFLLKDMEKAIKRIDEVIKKGQKIVIYGDYDVDGITSTSILFRAFKKLGIDVSYYLPDRINEGYGLNFEAVNYLKSLQTDLIITVDCGISAIEEVEYIKSQGMDVIITDHHECREDIPDTIVINPKRRDCTYPCKNLAGCGVAFKLIQALWMHYEIDGVDEFLDIVAIGTIADIVDLMGENRIIAKQGMEKLKTTDKCGLIALKAISGLEDKITSGGIAFQIAPRINAIGRLRDAKIAVELFTTNDYDKAMQIAKYLDQENRSRQKIEEEILNEAIIKIKDENLKDNKVIVISSPNWHVGVVGIVASKIVEIFHRPTIILCEEGSIARGSCRSIEGFNIFDALVDSEGYLEGFGGHEMAAGLQVKLSNINSLKEKLNTFAKNIDIEAYISKVKIDMILEGEDINFESLDMIKTLEPFGMGNPTPIFGMEDMFIKTKRYIGTGEKHIKLQFIKNGVYYDGVLFNYGADYMNKDWNNVDIAFNIDENNWMGKRTIQFIVRDIKPYKKWVRNSLKENYYRYLNVAKDSNDEECTMENIVFLKKDINFLKEFLCFEKGYVLVSSKESIDEIEYLFDLFNFGGNKITNESSGIIICPNISDIDECSDVLIYDFLLGEIDYKKLTKRENINVYHFYDNDTMSKIDNFKNSITINKEVLHIIINALLKGSIFGKITDIASEFMINPYQMYYAITYLRKYGVIEILSNKEQVKITLINREYNLDSEIIDNMALQKIEKVKYKLEMFCKEN
ncbi:MAG: single-stranded-DNA-specific exonuclease RecJ [Clostridium sp.]